MRSKLLAALEYARFEDDDDDAMNLNGEEFDIDKFMDFNEVYQLFACHGKRASQYILKANVMFSDQIRGY